MPEQTAPTTTPAPTPVDPPQPQPVDQPKAAPTPTPTPTPQADPIETARKEADEKLKAENELNARAEKLAAAMNFKASLPALVDKLGDEKLKAVITALNNANLGVEAFSNNAKKVLVETFFNETRQATLMPSQKSLLNDPALAFSLMGDLMQADDDKKEAEAKAKANDKALDDKDLLKLNDNDRAFHIAKTAWERPETWSRRVVLNKTL